MSQVPSTSQTPAAPSVADIIGSPTPLTASPPPTVSDIIGTPPPKIDIPGVASAASTTPAVPDAVTELGSAFGVTGTDPAATAAALRPMLEMMARTGQQQQAPQQQQQQFQQQTQQQQQIQQQQAPALDFSDLDLGDASPEIAKAFKVLGERSQAAISAATTKANDVQQALYTQQHQFHAQQQQAQVAQQAEVTDRAVNYIDGLASAKYGVGQNRTMVQTIAAEQVMATAGKLIQGMKSYGKVLPIEQVMNAAILMVDGAIPAVPASPAPPAIAPLGQTQAPGPAANVKRPSVGSSGAGQQLMSDARFMDGARAILAR